MSLIPTGKRSLSSKALLSMSLAMLTLCLWPFADSLGISFAAATVPLAILALRDVRRNRHRLKGPCLAPRARSGRDSKSGVPASRAGSATGARSGSTDDGALKPQTAGGRHALLRGCTRSTSPSRDLQQGRKAAAQLASVTLTARRAG